MTSNGSPSGRHAVLIGECPGITESAVAFRLLDWSVSLFGDADTLARSGAVTRLEQAGVSICSMTDVSAVGRDPGDVVVCCRSRSEIASSVADERAPLLRLDACSYVEDATGEVVHSCSELNAYMQSGLGLITRTKTDEGLTGRPFLPAGHLAAFFGGLHVVMLAEALTLDDAAPFAVIDVSMRESLLSVLHNAVGFAQWEDRDVARDFDPPRAGGRFQCTDGLLLISLFSGDHWAVVIRLLGTPEWAAGEWWRDSDLRFENRDLLNSAISEWCAGRSRLEAFTTLQDAGVPTAYLATADEAKTSVHIEARRAAEFPPHRELASAPARPTTGTAQPADIDPLRPLAGVTVCDLSWAWAGPYLTMSLAMLGATVIKLESSTRVDMHRLSPPFAPGPEEKMERAAGHVLTNRGKLSVEVDLKSEAGKALVREVASKSDLLIANFSPGALERLGLGFDDLRESITDRPFVFMTLTGFGTDGPWAQYRSLGAHLSDLGGLSAMTGDETTGAVNIDLPFSDPLGGIYGAAACLNYLRRARSEGRQFSVDVSQHEVLIAGISGGLSEQGAAGNARPGDMLGTGVYATLGAKEWVSISIVGSPQQATAVGLTGASDANGLVSALTQWVAQRSPGDAVEALVKAGVDAVRVVSAADLLHDEGLLADHFWEMYHGGDRPLLGPAAPWKVNGVRPPQLIQAPLVGEHSATFRQSLASSTK